MTTPIAAGPIDRRVGGWRPIETAPKDGTEILIFTVSGSRYVAHYNDLFSFPWRIHNSFGIHEKAPTHWTTLPATPNVEFSGTPAASSPEAPLERRVGPGEQED